MKDYAKLIMVLTCICLISGVLMAFVYGLTEEPINRARENSRMEAIQRVLPPAESVPQLEEATFTYNDKTLQTVTASNNGKHIATVLQVSTSAGYGGDIEIMVGILPDGAVQGVAILNHKETPGLGANIDTPEFCGIFKTRTLNNTDWRVKKDGGDIDEITAATISSRAVTDAVKFALEAYQAEHQNL